MTIFLLLILLGLLGVHLYFRYNAAGRLISKIPGQTPFPFVGNMLYFNCSPEKIWARMLGLVQEFYPIARLWNFISKGSMILIRHPDDVKALFTSKQNIDKANSGYSDLNLDGNCGLLLSGGDKWRQRRKLINPAFNPNILKVYYEIVNEHAEALIVNLTTRGKDSVVNLLPVFFKYTLGIICEAAMGVNLNNFGTEFEAKYRHAYEVCVYFAFYRATRPYLLDWMMHFLSVGRNQKRATKIVNDFSHKVIQERREYHERVGYQSFQDFVDDVDGANKTDSFGGRRKRLALLDLLLSAEIEGLIDQKGVLEEVENFMAAGYDTAAVAMTFTLLSLAENPKAQELCRAEVVKVVNENGGKITPDIVHKFEYLERCVKEALRLFPSVPIIGRYITDEMHLKNYVVPVKSEIFLLMYALHRDPNFWPEPNKFDPDRFLPENIQNRHSHAYLPFSAGPRSCIGYKLGMMQVKCTVAHILYNFYLEPVMSTANIEYSLNITLKPSKPVHAKLIRIDRK